MNVMMAEKYEFDQKLFDKVRKMMKEVFTSFIQAYIKDGQRYVNEIKLGCKYKQMDKIAQYAHPLKICQCKHRRYICIKNRRRY